MCAASPAAPDRRERAMRHRIHGLTSSTLLTAVSTLLFVLGCPKPRQQDGTHPPPHTVLVALPANEQLFLQVHARGDQIYTCKSDGAQFTWTLKAPDAQLFDKDGKPFGKHFAGPSWEANDGSRVTGKPVNSTPSPDADSIPWLSINILSHDGKGVLSRATTIQRINTKGGKAPASGCDASHTDQEVRVPYSADYVFYAPK
jgi:Protein of unknown function (DUF3455)